MCERNSESESGDVGQFGSHDHHTSRWLLFLTPDVIFSRLSDLSFDFFNRKVVRLPNWSKWYRKLMATWCTLTRMITLPMLHVKHVKFKLSKFMHRLFEFESICWPLVAEIKVKGTAWCIRSIIQVDEDMKVWAYLRSHWYWQPWGISWSWSVGHMIHLYLSLSRRD